MIGSATRCLEPRVKEEPTEIQMPGRIFSERKQLPSTSMTTMETLQELAPDNSRYNSNVQVKPEPVDDAKMFFPSNRHYPVPRDPRRSMLSPGAADSQSSRDPRKRAGKCRPIFIQNIFFLFKIFWFTGHFALPAKLEEAEDDKGGIIIISLRHSQISNSVHTGSDLFGKRLKMEH